MTRKLLHFASLLCLFVLPHMNVNAAPPVQKPDFFWYDGVWAHERSDIRPDAAAHFHRLDNGFRFAVISSKQPAGRVCMWLAVQAGSLMEEPHQRGYAHFVEHMAFNGTRNFPPGTLIPFFQKHGMSFGGDTNAHTTLHETVYKLDLADTGTEALKTGLSILRDFADGMTMLPQEVEDEKGVILAEKRDRENETVLAGRAWRGRMHAGTALVHDTIGTEECLRAADSASLMEFYRKWYRPERMILVIAGDVQPQDLFPLVRDSFDSMGKSDTPLPFPQLGFPAENGIRFFVQQRPVDFVNLGLAIRHPRQHVSDSLANERHVIIDSLVTLCFRQRLLQRQQEANAPWNRASLRGDWRDGFSPALMLTAMTTPDKWRDALDALQKEYASARTYGFTASELYRAKTQLGNTLRRRLRETVLRTNAEIAEEFISAVNRDRVYVSSAYDMRRFEQLHDGISLDEVNAALRLALLPEDFLLFVGGKVDMQEEAELQVLWKKLSMRAPEKHQEKASTPFPYLPLPAEPATLPRLQASPQAAPAGDEVTAHTGTLPNGVQVHLVPLPHIDKGRIHVSLLFGQGLESLPDADIPMARLAEIILSEEGPGRLNMHDCALLLTTRGISLRESYTDHGAMLTGHAPSAEAQTLLTALWTQYVDPLPADMLASRHARALEKLNSQHAARFDSVDGMTKALRFAWFCGNSPRFLPVDDVMAQDIQPGMMRDFILRQRARGLRHVLISGDIVPQDLLPALTRFFGRLQPPAGQAGKIAGITPPRFPLGDHSLLVEREPVDKTQILLAWRADMDISDRKKMASRHMVTAVLRDRLRQELRERLGAAYSPQVLHRIMDSYDGFGFILANVNASHERASETAEAIRNIAVNLARDGVSREEIERLRGPMLTAWKSRFADGRIWHNLLRSDLLTGRPMTRWNVEFGPLLQALTPEETNNEAAALFGTASPAELTIKSGKGAAQ